MLRLTVIIVTVEAHMMTRWLKRKPIECLIGCNKFDCAQLKQSDTVQLYRHIADFLIQGSVDVKLHGVIISLLNEVEVNGANRQSGCLGRKTFLWPWHCPWPWKRN